MKAPVVKKLLSGFALAAVLISCGSSADKKDGKVNEPDSIDVPAAEAPAANGEEKFAEFDWTTVPQSNANVGGFPYLTAPAGFFIQSRSGSEASTTGYTELKDFNKLIIYDGKAFYNAEGKVAKLKFSMKEKQADWNQYSFDRSVDDYLKNIGAKMLGKLKLNQAQKEFLNKEDDMTIYNHITGDPYNDPVRFYALNHPDGKVMFQVFSNSASGEVAVVQLAAFQQSIKAPTAMEMKKEIDDKGKATLNINFDTDKSTLLPDGQKAVDEIYTLLTDNAGLNLSIEGHTDNSGTTARNKQLSTERANTIMKSLTTKGISASRLTAVGYGSDKPLVENDSEANKAKNRRVELVKK